MFREGIGVVVEGALQADGTFATDRLMIKHDNEYQAPGNGDSRSVKQLAETLEPTASGDPR
jgi:cytochrome c-type biogenesis protein CcmE